MLRLSIFHEGAGVGDAIERGADGDAGGGGEFFLGVVGEEDVGATASGIVDFCGEGVFLGGHGGMLVMW